MTRSMRSRGSQVLSRGLLNVPQWSHSAVHRKVGMTESVRPSGRGSKILMGSHQAAPDRLVGRQLARLAQALGARLQALCGVPRDLMLRVIGEAADNGYKVVVFTGGEPTLAGADLLEGIRLARSRGLVAR